MNTLEREVLDQIKALCQLKGFIHALASLAITEQFVFDDITEIDPWNRLHINEYNILVGFYLQSEKDESYPSHSELEEMTASAIELMRRLHDAYNQPMQEYIEKLISGRADGKMPPNGADTLREPMLYGGTSATYFQLAELSKEKFKNDADWLQNNHGVDIAEFLKIFHKLRKISANRINEIRGDPERIMNSKAIDFFRIGLEDFSEFDDKIVSSFLNIFSTKLGPSNLNYDGFGTFNEFEARPLIRMESDDFFFPSAHALGQALYEAPFYWMLEDQDYAPTALNNRGEYLESTIARWLAEVFGPNNVYQAVQVQEKKGRTSTDIDVLVNFEGRMIVVQAKSKRLTLLSRLGDEASLRSDFRKAVQSAYDQAIVGQEGIASGQKIYCSLTGEAIELEESIEEFYTICVLSDEYPSLQFQLSKYLNSSEFETRSPYIITLFDLDLLRTYLSDPFDFLYFLEKRTKYADKLVSDSEINIIGFHLNQKLFLENDLDQVLISGDFGQMVDANFLELRGIEERVIGADKLLPKWQNQSFIELCDAIKKGADGRKIDCLFFVMDFSSSAIDQLFKLVDHVVELCKREGKKSSGRMMIGEGGVSVIASDSDIYTIQREAYVYAEACKYKHKKNKWLGWVYRLRLKVTWMWQCIRTKFGKKMLILQGSYQKSLESLS